MLFKNINSLVSKSWKCFLMFYLEIRYLYLDNQNDCQITSLSNILLIFFDFAIFLKICQDTEVICILTLQASNINSAIFKVVKLSIAMGICDPAPTSAPSIGNPSWHMTKLISMVNLGQEYHEKVFPVHIPSILHCVPVGVGSLWASSNCKL